MRRRTLLLSTAGLALTATRCAPRGRSLEPLHPAEARFHDPLASGVIDRERWIVDSLPGGGSLRHRRVPAAHHHRRSDGDGAAAAPDAGLAALGGG